MVTFMKALSKTVNMRVKVSSDGSTLNSNTKVNFAKARCMVLAPLKTLTVSSKATINSVS